VENTEVQNLTSAQNNVQNADIAKVTSNLTQFNVLEQTGFDALSQAQSAEQNVLKLLQ
jgi:flagellin